MSQPDRTASRRRLRDVAGHRREQAQQLVAQSTHACDTLRAKLADLEAELARLQQPGPGPRTAATTGHEERYRQQLSQRAAALKVSLASETERLALRRQELAAAAREAEGLQRLLEVLDARAKKEEARAEQRHIDEHNARPRERRG